VKLRGRGVVHDQEWAFPDSRQRQAKEVVLKLPADLPKGRHVFAVSPTGMGGEFADPWLAVDVE
jgi:hypothetical protein